MSMSETRIAANSLHAFRSEKTNDNDLFRAINTLDLVRTLHPLSVRGLREMQILQNKPIFLSHTPSHCAR